MMSDETPWRGASDAEIAAFKRNIEMQLDEYETAIAAAAAWYQAWKARQAARGKLDCTRPPESAMK